MARLSGADQSRDQSPRDQSSPDEVFDTPRAAGGSTTDGTASAPGQGADETPLVEGYLTKKGSGFPFAWQAPAAAR